MRVRGFTLIELLVVVAIMGILMALIVPSFTGIGQGIKRRSAVSQLTSTFSLARQWAITRREETCVLFPTIANNAAMGYRAWRVWGSKSGFLGEWNYCPAGIVLLPQDKTRDIFMNPNGNPTSNIPGLVGSVSMIRFKIDGSLFGGSNPLISITEGWTVGNSVTGKPNSWISEIEVHNLTGLVQQRTQGL